MTALFLRRATTADVSLIRQLAEKIWWDHYPSIISDAQIAFMLEKMYHESVLLAQMEEAGQVFWLAEHRGQVFGFVSLNETGPGDFFIHKFYLDNRERGLGTGVFGLLLEQYPALNTLRLRVNRCNYKSINFYYKMGFKIEFCIDTPFGEDYVLDDFQMIFEAKNN